MPEIGIIGGSGVYSTPGVEFLREETVSTPYGEPSDSFRICRIEGVEVAFLNRHGREHIVAPHKVNYMANIWAFKTLGVRHILATGAVGGIDENLHPGDFVLVEQIIDMTKSRPSTFYEEGAVYHVDFTEPYCWQMRQSVLKASNALNIEVYNGGTYVCTEGPRLESKGEIHFFKKLGASVVGMTTMPEAALARELEICFCTLCIVTNYAAGIAEGRHLTAKEVVETMNTRAELLGQLIRKSVMFIPEKRLCHCKDALKEAKI
ncbi:MAG: S-methyl-5'-thioadenosine phosphorylase [Candidatus Magnetoovum sp. WYHC-5]|nr:S-methyl-5'-thioadenosine phosphorylase [Candidatus Magnetoovum sp. WYHC-5]